MICLSTSNKCKQSPGQNNTLVRIETSFFHISAILLRLLLQEATITRLKHLLVVTLEGEPAFLGGAELLVAELGLLFGDESFLVPTAICSSIDEQLSMAYASRWLSVLQSWPMRISESMRARTCFVQRHEPKGSGVDGVTDLNSFDVSMHIGYNGIK
jgi:hypothetical protein